MAINLVRKNLHCKTFEYSTVKYPFKEILESIFGCKVDQIHKYLGGFEAFQRANDQSTLAHKVFYSNYHDKIKPTYQNLIHNVIAPIVNEPFYYQVVPTFRIGLPGNKFVGEYHKDSKYNHKPYEVNFNLGISGYYGEAALKVESNDESSNLISLECPYGSIFSFDHIDCMHGSDVNPQDITMVSFDFRLALVSMYEHCDSKSVNMGIEFNRGSYFSSYAVSP